MVVEQRIQHRWHNQTQIEGQQRVATQQGHEANQAPKLGLNPRVALSLFCIPQRPQNTRLVFHPLLPYIEASLRL